MKLENAIRILAGSMILISLVMYYLYSPWWHLLTGFVGVNLIQSAITGICPAEYFLRKLGVSR